MMGTPDAPVWWEPWRDRAACANTDPSIWWEARHLDTARAICAGCPVTVECLEDALRYPKTSDPVGVRAGTTPEERNAIRTQRKRDAA